MVELEETNFTRWLLSLTSETLESPPKNRPLFLSGSEFLSEETQEALIQPLAEGPLARPVAASSLTSCLHRNHSSSGREENPGKETESSRVVREIWVGPRQIFG
ncbi:hypothetical protein KM043_012044 [Ampulex compressa]|nr:hypothetical protein KM043_012044 [Ampulex compressa]